jgi:Holliday junction resolvase RusA-like endonuclease
MDEISIKIWMEPIPKGRPRMTRKGRTYTPARTRDFESEARRQARAQYTGKPVQPPRGLEVSFIFHCRRPARPKYEYPTKVGDLTNIIKSVEDALNGVIWHDDVHIVSIGRSFKKFAAYKEQPYIEVHVKEFIEGFADSD